MLKRCDMKKLIKTEEEYEEALERIGELMNARSSTPEGDELELLSTLVELYEDEHWDVSPPSPIEAIKFRMEQQGMSRKDLVPYIGKINRVSEILNGKRTLSLQMIRRLHRGLLIPAESLLHEGSSSEVFERAAVDHVARYPLREMTKRGWFPGRRVADVLEDAEELVGELLAPLKPANRELALLRQHVRTGSSMNSCALNAWLGRVLGIASSLNLCDYTAGTINREFMRQLVALSLLEEGPRLAAELLSQAGIAMVVLGHLPRTHLDGAALMAQGHKPVVAVTLRYDRLDNFWFTLCHELAHVSRHLKKGCEHEIFVDDLQSEGDGLEADADEMAAAWLIPQRSWLAANLTSHPTAAGALQLAQTLRISPAIVAGRVRRETENYRLLTKLVGNKKVRRLFDGMERGWSYQPS